MSGVTLTINSVSGTFVGGNGGTQIADSAPSTRCWYKTNYRGDPREWGAIGDGAPSTDDTLALENWLGAYGSAVSKNASTPPTNFGPWIASLPGNYKTISPLICPANANLMGPANVSTDKGSPAVRIFAGGSFSGSPVLIMNDYCRLSGIAIDASNLAAVDAVDIAGTHVAIDGHSLIENAGNQTTGAYNVLCPGPNVASGAKVDGLQIKDSQIIGAASDNVNLACPNVRLIGDTISGAGGHGVVFGNTDLTIADGVVEQSGSTGIEIDTARYVSIGNEYIDHNSKTAATHPAGIQVKGSSHVSICGNHLEGNAGVIPTGAGNYSSQIRYSLANDNISLCGNVYTADNLPINVGVTPQYVYDADASGGTTLTNAGIYENAGNQSSGIYSPNAAPILPQITAPHVPVRFISGLGLANVGSSATQVSIAPGEASDSTGTASIVLTSSCTVDLGSAAGLNALDQGSVAAGFSYFFYVVANSNGGNPSCMASRSAQAPTFVNAPSSFRIGTMGTTLSGSGIITNVGSIAGALPGDPLVATGLSGPPVIGSFGTVATVTATTSATLYGTAPNAYLTYSGSAPSGFVAGMQIVDATNCIPAATIIASIGSGQINLVSMSTNASVALQCNISSGITIYASNAQEITMASGAIASSSNPNETLNIYTGRYRLVGALYTFPTGSPTVVPFTQNGDTVYLTTPVADVPAGSLSTSSSPIVLASVPSGIPVQALGRCTGGSGHVLLYSPGPLPGTPAAFPTAPGYSVNSTIANTPFSYSLYTNSTQEIVGVADATSTLYCITDGWVFHR
jgi:hypothetical protein